MLYINLDLIRVLQDKFGTTESNEIILDLLQR